MVTMSYIWLHIRLQWVIIVRVRVTVGYMWLHQVTYGYHGLYVVTKGYM